MSKIVLIDYGAGNIQSVYNALLKISRDDDLALDIHKTNDPTDIDNADYIILPGVGSYSACMNGILNIKGLKDSIDHNVLDRKKPFLGICVGMQLLSKKGYEHGEHDGLGYLDGSVKPFTQREDLKIPHMGWNKIEKKQDHVLLKHINDQDYVYFVHSYFMNTNSEYIALTCDYGHDFPALVIKDNIVGAQFHPEKSQNVGLQLLRNFISWKI